MVGDSAGTEFALSQKQKDLLKDNKNVHESLNVYLTLCAQEQVYCIFDLREIVPDLDDPHIPTWVWDWLLKDGKITEAERHLVAQHEDEAGGNLCVKCGVDMGADNPRQYCGKNMCLGLGFE